MSKHQRHDKSRQKNQPRQTRGQDAGRNKSSSKPQEDSQDGAFAETVGQHDSKMSAGHHGTPRVIEHTRHESAKGLIPIQSLVAPRKQIQVKQIHPRNAKTLKKSYKVIFFDTVHIARSEIARIEELKQTCDQLNIVIRAEAQVETQDLELLGAVYKGAAWALIHDRRVQDGWYEVPQE